MRNLVCGTLRLVLGGYIHYKMLAGYGKIQIFNKYISQVKVSRLQKSFKLGKGLKVLQNFQAR